MPEKVSGPYRDPFKLEKVSTFSADHELS
jgi:hypothetical protein